MKAPSTERLNKQTAPLSACRTTPTASQRQLRPASFGEGDPITIAAPVMAHDLVRGVGPRGRVRSPRPSASTGPSSTPSGATAR
jgi:hypothetical protein